MNLYVLVEDGKSGRIIMDRWIGMLLPGLRRAEAVGAVQDNHYVVFSGFGYPRLLGTNPASPSKNVLGQTIETINASQKFDYLVIFLDGDNEGPWERTRQVREKIAGYQETLSIPFAVFVQNKCLETWLLGNRDFFPSEASPAFSSYAAHYDVSSQDPELMGADPGSALTDSLFHEKYLRQMMKEAGHLYSKSRPAPIVCTPSFMTGLQERVLQTCHLGSLLYFFDFMADFPLS